MKSRWQARQAFLSALGAIYVAAFMSYWLQFPGLLGEDGLLPAKNYWQSVVARSTPAQSLLQRYNKIPCLLWWLTDVDVALEGLALLGILCGAAAVAGLHHASLFLAMFLSYLTLFVTGQTWLGFQWDIFLLETGASAVLYAPWFSAYSNEAAPVSHPMTWVLRAQWVKFMLMSGVVKVTADCPTWKRLTALEFHFASTCLPTAEAWLHHSLPPMLLRVGVAFMFLCELVAPLLLLMPVTIVRRVGVCVQVPLQIAIMLTGNYNWFNLHTMALLLPAWERDVALDTELQTPLAFLWAPLRAWEMAWDTHAGRAAAGGAALTTLAYAAITLFPIHHESSAANGVLDAMWRSNALRIQNRATRPFTERLLNSALQPATFMYLYTMVIVAALAYAAGSYTSPRRCDAGPGRRTFGLATGMLRAAWRVALGAASVLYLGVTLLPLESIAGRSIAPLIPEWGSDLRISPSGGVTAFNLRTYSVSLHEQLQPFHVSSSYGLFRRMTGVGQASPDVKRQTPQLWGWGQQPPSIVAVPAVVLEGRRGSGKWREIPFRYAPYKESRAPRRTAPHQPRLDWQMWFAALGQYEYNGWLLHLAYKIMLGGESAALQLLDGDAYPFSRSRPPDQMRASLYHYDFTRVASEWASRIPGTVQLPANCSVWGPYLAPSSRVECSQWWSRVRVKEYFPEASIVARWSCEVVVVARRVGAPLRRFVGFELRLAGTAAVWFVDGPLLVISAAVAVPWLLRAGISAMRRCCRRRSAAHT